LCWTYWLGFYCCQVAQTYANGCVFAHNANRNTQYTALGGAATGVGENIAEGTSGFYTVETLTNLWFQEKSSYTCGTAIDDTNFETFGHYTQMVWANTLNVGCGAATCSGNLFLVCDYSPPGNYIGETPFPVANCQSCGATSAVVHTSAAPVQTSAPPVQTSQHITTANQALTSQVAHPTSANPVPTSANQVTSQHVTQVVGNSTVAPPNMVASATVNSFQLLLWLGLTAILFA